MNHLVFNAVPKPIDRKGFLFDLIIYISVLFLIREIYIPTVGFIANGLFWSFTTLAIATWRMKIRKVTWKELGLRKPDKLWKTLAIATFIFTATMLSLIAFQVLIDHFPFFLEADTSSESAASKFGTLRGNWAHFFLIIPFILLESTLEEVLDRGFLMNWIEKLFSSTRCATIVAVILQASIFGFRHSYDFSERSITVGIIGLIMGVAYVKFGRNLWPLVIAHCVLNTVSMMGRVLD